MHVIVQCTAVHTMEDTRNNLDYLTRVGAIEVSSSQIALTQQGAAGAPIFTCTEQNAP